MRILMVSWEYPPRVVGGIARHVKDLSEALVRAGHDVTVLTADAPERPQDEWMGGVRILRAYAGTPPAREFLTWVLQLNVSMLERAMRLPDMGRQFDVVHVHDWLGAYAGKALKHAVDLPMVATIHATEWGRNNGLHNDLQRYISDVEWWLAYESWQVICCSFSMRAELKQVFQIPDDKIQVIANGVYVEPFRIGPQPEEVRWRYAAPDEAVVFHVGRLVREKGLDVLIDAIPFVLKQRPKTKFIISGKGPHEPSLREHAMAVGVYGNIYFTGYIDDETRNALYRSANVAVFPSLYEPFGIVALEAMAAGAPVIVSDTGGISEVVDHGLTGYKAGTGNPSSLADQIIWALDHPDDAKRVRDNAFEVVRTRYNWDDIAAATTDVYRRVMNKRLVNEAGMPEVLSMAPSGFISRHLRYGDAGPYWDTSGDAFGRSGDSASGRTV